MNSAPSRNKFIDRFRGHLPEILYTKVPIPAFMETPISLDLIFGNNTSGRKNISEVKKPSSGPSTLEGKLIAGKNTRYAIENKDLEIDNGTWIVGNIEYGITARAKGRMQGEKFYVSQLILLKK